MKVPRTATVTALEPTQTLALAADDFDHLVAQHVFAEGLGQEASRRLTQQRTLTMSG